MFQTNIRNLAIAGSSLVTLFLIVYFRLQLCSAVYWLYEIGWETIPRGFWLGFFAAWFVLGRRFALTRYIHRK
ncbi:hypothetical protein H6F89_34350 [Cyanobacteria bacterium FACHB-63]|nr:hypothetical protein [Cyanobacteria bacterium FACHB-63]